MTAIAKSITSWFDLNQSKFKFSPLERVMAFDASYRQRAKLAEMPQYRLTDMGIGN